MDIYGVLKKDHEEVKQLLEKLSDTTENAVKTRSKGLDKLRLELTAHSRAEEEVFYAALRDHDETRSNVLEGEQEHHMVDILLEELSKLDVSKEQWTAKLTVLKEQIEHHVEEEEGDVFKKAKKILSSEQAKTLAEEFKQHKKQHAGDLAA